MTQNLKANRRDEDPVASCLKRVEPIDLPLTVSDFKAHLLSEARYMSFDPIRL